MHYFPVTYFQAFIYSDTVTSERITKVNILFCAFPVEFHVLSFRSGIVKRSYQLLVI